MLAYAMTLALPESYTTVKQNLWLRSPFTSAEIVGVVQAEWARRKTSHNSGALIAIQQQGSGKSREKGTLYGPDKHAYCTEHKAYGHDTSKCIRLHGRPSQPRFSPAAVATTTAPPFVLYANVAQYDSDGSAFISTSVVPADLRFVVDSGASEHMVTSASFLTDLYTIPTRKIAFGNGDRLPSSQAGTFLLGDLVFKASLSSRTSAQILSPPSKRLRLTGGISIASMSTVWRFYSRERPVTKSSRPPYTAVFLLSRQANWHTHISQREQTISWTGISV